MSPAKPFYRFVERVPNPPYTDRLVWRNDNEPHDTVCASEWWFWRLWRFYPGGAGVSAKYLLKAR